MRASTCFFAFVAFAAACGDDGSAVEDAGRDAGADGGPAERDAGPMCEPECGVGAICCAAGGEAACVDPANDLANCGECGRDCVALSAGTLCDRGNCRCGSFELGCAGRTICCPPRPGDDVPYCADLARSPDDCGACDTRCDPSRADRCDGSRCLCGAGSRRQCDGTPADTCCPDTVGSAVCVDTTSDPLHCGGCGNACPSGTCTDGTCE